LIREHAWASLDAASIQEECLDPIILSGEHHFSSSVDSEATVGRRRVSEDDEKFRREVAQQFTEAMRAHGPRTRPKRDQKPQPVDKDGVPLAVGITMNWYEFLPHLSPRHRIFRIRVL